MISWCSLCLSNIDSNLSETGVTVFLASYHALRNPVTLVIVRLGQYSVLIEK